MVQESKDQETKSLVQQLLRENREVSCFNTSHVLVAPQGCMPPVPCSCSCSCSCHRQMRDKLDRLLQHMGTPAGRAGALPPVEPRGSMRRSMDTVELNNEGGAAEE